MDMYPEVKVGGVSEADVFQKGGCMSDGGVFWNTWPTTTTKNSIGQWKLIQHD